MSDKLSKNLNILMQEAHLNAEELSRRTGLPASSIKKIRNNDQINPTLSTLAPLAKYFALTISQLIGDEPFPKSRLKGAYQIDIDVFCHLPLISWEEAINWPQTIKTFHPTIATEYAYSQSAYGLSVEEESWENLTKGTLLLIDPEVQVEHRDFIIVYKSGQKAPTLKQALYDDGQIYLKPLIEGYQIISLSIDHTILGTVIEYKKQLKKQSIVSKGFVE